MSEVKSLIKRLLKNKPSAVEAEDLYHCYLIGAIYNNKDLSYSVYLNTKTYNAVLYIASEGLHYKYSCDLTEQEYMEIKWQMEKWNECIKNELFDTLRDFVKTNDPADDLLEDDD